MSLPLVGCTSSSSFSDKFRTVRKKKMKHQTPPLFVVVDGQNRVKKLRELKYSHSDESVLSGSALLQDKDFISSMTLRANILLRLVLHES